MLFICNLCVSHKHPSVHGRFALLSLHCTGTLGWSRSLFLRNNGWRHTEYVLYTHVGSKTERTPAQCTAPLSLRVHLDHPREPPCLNFTRARQSSSGVVEPLQ